MLRSTASHKKWHGAHFLLNTSKKIRFFSYNECSAGKKGQGSSLCNLVSAVRNRGVDHTFPWVHVVALGSPWPAQSKSIGFGKASALAEQAGAHHEGDSSTVFRKDTGFLSSRFGLVWFFF